MESRINVILVLSLLGFVPSAYCDVTNSSEKMTPHAAEKSRKTSPTELPSIQNNVQLEQSPNLYPNSTTAIDHFTENKNESTSTWPYPVCKVTLSTSSAEHLKSLFQTYKPNFARIKLILNHHLVNYRPQVIRPFHWIWTYESRNQLFYYINWPADFAVLSFGLLDRYTLPDGQKLYLNVENSVDKCSLRIGEPQTNKVIGDALANLTVNYIFKSRPGVGVYNSFWCYHAQVPTVYDSILHKLRIYTAFPIEVALYNCCRIVHDTINKQNTVDCNLPQRHRSLEGMVIPYIISLVAFAYFPALLAQIYKYGMTSENRGQNGYRNIEDEADLSYIYLSTGSPISCTKAICSVFGLERKFPVLSARLLRLFALLLLICPIAIRISIYKKYLYDIIVALIQHRCPIGFVSMISGYYESKRVFLAVLGGPFVVLFIFVIVSVIFFVVPGDIDKILETCSSRNIEYNSDSPLFFNIHDLERFSNTPINDKYGFLKAGSMCVAGVYMLTNPSFWLYTAKVLFRRLVGIYIEIRNRSNRVVGLITMTLIGPLIIALNLVETAIIVLVYGLPIINFVSTLARGFLLTLIDVVSTICPILGHHIVVKVTITLIIVSSFVYYVICFCAIFMDTCLFLSKVVIFTFLAVIVYPGTSFGYVFYGIAFIYYTVNVITQFGESYHELLKDIIHISKELTDDQNKIRVDGDTLCLGDADGQTINSIRVHNKVIQLTLQQKAAMSEVQRVDPPVMVKAKSRNSASELGVPSALYWRLVASHQPIHKYVALAFLKLVAISCLMLFMLYIVTRKHDVTEAGFSEIMNVLFLVAVGGLPKFLDCATCNVKKGIRRNLERGKLRSAILAYWNESPDIEIINIADGDLEHEHSFQD